MRSHIANTAALGVTLLLISLLSAPCEAQTAGREPVPGQASGGGTTWIDTSNPVTASGVLRLWRAYAARGGRAILKVYRPEGDRLVLVGSSGLETLPEGRVGSFTCFIPVARNDLVGVYCPDDVCVDRVSDGAVLEVEGDSGTRPLDELGTAAGGPAIWAGSSLAVDIPSTAGTDLVLPVVGRTPGLNDTQWSTALELFNTATSDTTVALYLNLSDRDNTTPASSAQVILPPRSTIVYEDAVLELFALSEATGSLDIISSAPVIAHARVANLGTGEGTYGQLVPAVPARWAVGDDTTPGLNPNSDILYLFELRQDASWRSNLGLVNTSAVPLLLEVSAHGAGGPLGEPLQVELAPFSHTQVVEVLDVLGVARGTARVRLNVRAASGSSGRFLAYASRVDNRTGDGVFLPGAKEAALP